MYGWGAGIGVLTLVLSLAAAFPAPQTIPGFAWLAVAGVAGCAVAGIALGVWVLRNDVPLHTVLLWRLGFTLGTLALLACWIVYFAAVPQATLFAALPPLVGVALLFLPLLHWFPGALGLSVAGGLAVWGLAGFPSPAALPPNWYVAVGAFALFLAMVFSASLLSRWIGNLVETAATARRDMANLRTELTGSEHRANFESDHRHGLERELTLARDAAEQAIRAKTEFLATMSHEIRTPLNGILPILELLQDTPLNEEQKGYLGTAFKSSRHLLRLINDILDFAKVEAGKLELENIELNLRELAESVTDLMRRSAESKGLELMVYVNADVPPLVRGDPIRLRQVLTNLVSNAVKFTEKGSVRVEVKRQRLDRKDVELLFAVIDTGVGMAQDTTRRLFQAFSQADASTTRKHGGTGLGLVICKRLVELMGGKIGVHSTLGKGSTFWFVLPMRRSLHDLPSLRRDLAGVRALTLIKASNERKRVGEMLSSWGIIEERTESAISAIGKLKSCAMLGESWAFELVLVDARGQERGVHALVREIRAVSELKSMQILIAAPPDWPASDLQAMPNVAVVEAPLQKEKLKVHLDRLLDVGEQAAWPSSEGAAAALDAEADSPSGAARATANGAAPVPGRVLLVEDNPINLAVARKVLERLGMTCLIAQDGRQALNLIEREGPVDLVLMDVQMPGIDGYETTREIRQREEAGRLQRAPIVAMTANAMQGDREKCLQAGMDDYVAKPIELSVLRMVLLRWLGEAGRGDQRLAQDGSKQPIRLRDDLEIDLAAAAGAEDSADAHSPGTKAQSAPGPTDVPQEALPEPVAHPSAPERQPPPTDAESICVDTVIDLQVLEELRDVMDEEFVGLVRTYIRNTPGQIARLDEAAHAGDVGAMVRPAHSLKSSSANVGAIQVVDLAREIEVSARESRRTAAAAALPALREAFARAASALTDYLTRVP
jgi:signal transduction histidine kinase/CheY-like chemotaxis protein